MCCAVEANERNSSENISAAIDAMVRLLHTTAEGVCAIDFTMTWVCVDRANFMVLLIAWQESQATDYSRAVNVANSAANSHLWLSLWMSEATSYLQQEQGEPQDANTVGL